MFVLLLPTAAIAAVVFVFGWLLMKKLDRFLDENCRTEEERMQSGGGTLRIGFANPLVADSLTDALARYAAIQPDASVRIFHDSAEHLCKALASHKLDVVLLPKTAVIPLRMRCNVQIVSLCHTPVILRYGGLPIEPLAAGTTVQQVCWLQDASASRVDRFVACMREACAASIAK